MYDVISEMIDNIILWKNKYNDIYILRIKNNVYIFRILTKKEYINILSLQDGIKYNIEDYIINNCVLCPEDKNNIDNQLAGEIDYLIKSILSLSGFSENDNILKDIEHHREKITILDNQIVILICKAFPHIKPEDIDNFNYNELLRHLALAEAILDTKLIIEKPLDKIDFDKDNIAVQGKPVMHKHPHQTKEEK